MRQRWWRLALSVTVGAMVMTSLGAVPPVSAVALEPAVTTLVPGQKAQVGPYKVVWLSGTPYEMGRQHGELLREELRAAKAAISWSLPLRMLLMLAESRGLIELAERNSYPDVLEEMRGFLDATRDLGWTKAEVLALNFGDVLVEHVIHGKPVHENLVPGCSQFVATGAATRDGRLYHGRLLDWDKIDFVLENPVIFVRQPQDGIAHATIGFPGNVSPYSGLNAAGLSIASNEAHPRDNRVNDRTGRSHVQMVSEILKRCRTLAEAEAFIAAQDHMTFESLTIADGNSKEAAVFEMAPNHVGIRPLRQDIVWATNHFVAPETAPLDKEPVAPSSLRRFERLGQLLSPTTAQSLYGRIDPAAMVGIMRDRIDPWTGEERPVESFDDGRSLATNGALYAILFDPEAHKFWVATAKTPVPSQPFVGFSLTDLLERREVAVLPEPTSPVTVAH